MKINTHTHTHTHQRLTNTICQSLHTHPREHGVKQLEKMYINNEIILLIFNHVLGIPSGICDR